MKCLFASTSFSPVALFRIGKWVDGATLHASNSLDSIFSPKLRELSKHQSFQKFRKFFSQVTRVRFQGLNRSSNVQLASRGETTMAENVTAEGQKGDSSDNNEGIPGKRGADSTRFDLSYSDFLREFFFRLLARLTRNYLPNVNRYEVRLWWVGFNSGQVSKEFVSHVVI